MKKSFKNASIIKKNAELITATGLTVLITAGEIFIINLYKNFLLI